MNSTQMSNLEQEVMAIVWDLKEVKVRDVMEKVQSRKDLAYTTIATIFTRLEHKGLLTRSTQGSSYLYKPKISKEVYSKSIAKSFIAKFTSSFGSMAISAFAESIHELPESKRKYFLELLEAEKNDI